MCIHDKNLDKNMARLRRDQGQVNSDGEPQVDRNGISLSNHCWLLMIEVVCEQEYIFLNSFLTQQMERFKIVERETKTKAYSKEVLYGIESNADF